LSTEKLKVERTTSTAETSVVIAKTLKQNPPVETHIAFLIRAFYHSLRLSQEISSTILRLFLS